MENLSAGVGENRLREHLRRLKEFEEEEKGGGWGRDRTADTAIFSRMLYQLSYLGIPGT